MSISTIVVAINAKMLRVKSVAKKDEKEKINK
jgi:hypothetical protein